MLVSDFRALKRIINRQSHLYSGNIDMCDAIVDIDVARFMPNRRCGGYRRVKFTNPEGYIGVHLISSITAQVGRHVKWNGERDYFDPNLTPPRGTF